jgi:hypothetical protein
VRRRHGSAEQRDDGPRQASGSSRRRATTLSVPPRRGVIESSDVRNLRPPREPEYALVHSAGCRSEEQPAQDQDEWDDYREGRDATH